MNSSDSLIPVPQLWTRRKLIGSMALAFTAPGAFAEQLALTPRQTEGPFYPDKLPLDTDNDLLIINDGITPAVGEVTHLTGRLLDAKGDPIRNAVVEIWQVDGKGVYLHKGSGGADKRDANFQGFGRFETNSKGEYRFRTIKPVPYPGRPAPHIHFKVKRGDRELLTTQLMIRGHEGNRRDGIFAEAGDAIDQELIQADFLPIPESKTGEYYAKFEIVLGRTPEDKH